MPYPYMSKWTARSLGGVLSFGDYNTRAIKDHAKKNPGALYELKAVLPESQKMRKWFEGAIVPYFAFLSGMDWKDAKVLDDARELIKIEFNAEMVVWNGEKKKIGRSTKGRENLNQVAERVLEWIMDNGGNPKVVDPKEYKHWRDTIYPYGGVADNYIDHLIECGELEIPQL